MPYLDRNAVWRERALLVAALPPSRGAQEGQDPLDELRRLAQAAGADVQGSVVQRLNRPDPATYVGSGKAEEIALKAREVSADVIISGNNLSPAHVRNLENITHTKVVDRTELILDIFARRAMTKQAKLQVEMAQLQYSLPRLRRKWTHLSRIEGGIGLRGPGEKQLEVDRRLAQKRISDLRRSLEQIRKRKEREVTERSDQHTVSLVGYTNAGKSSLLNTLTGANVHTSDTLFSTLDTRTRSWQADKGIPVLLSDTVGFIQDLPHALVESFHATLEESSRADLLLHVVDISLPDPLPLIQSVEKVLGELNLSARPTFLILNKLDALRDRIEIPILASKNPNTIAVSSRTGEGIEELRERVRDFFLKEMVEFDIRTHQANGRLISFLRKMGRVTNVTYEEDRVRIRGRILERHLGRATKMNGEGLIDEE